MTITPETILEATVRQGLAVLPADQANKEIIRLHLEVGRLENEVAKLRMRLGLTEMRRER